MELLNYTIFSENGTISFEKPIMVCIHGFGVGNANWLYQVRHLKKQYDMLLIELPSHGRSKVKMSDLEPNFDSVSHKVLEVLDHLGIPKATFLGVSLGTLIIKHIVFTYPEKVDKYILIGPIGEFTWLLRAALHLVMLLLPIAPLNFVLTLGCLVIMPFKKLKHGRNLFLKCARRLERKEVAVWCRVALSFKQTQELYANATGDEPNGLYLVGELDYFFMTMLKNDMKRVRNLTIIHNAGHICNIDQYECVNKLIVAFQETHSIDGLCVNALSA